MKALVSGLLVIGLTSLGFSQTISNGVNTVELEDVTVSATNASYLSEVNDPSTPEVVQTLHLKAANFDATSAPGFDRKSKNSYEAIFKATNGSLTAAYGPTGRIIFSYAKFSDVTLPMNVRQKAFKNNLGWQMSGNLFVSTYAENQQIKKRYKIDLRNGNSKKRLVIDMK